MSSAPDLARMVPGFDFLQGLMKSAGAGLPGMGQWIAPTLNPEELDKRIQELKTVQFWLEQNARLLATTIQALEVQRMTLATLQTMNLPLSDLADSLKIKTPEAAAPPPAAAPTAQPPQAPSRRNAPKKAPAATPAAKPAVDPLQWWGALTQQFTELASQALKDSPAEAAAAALKTATAAATNAVNSAAKGAARKATQPLGSGVARGRARSASARKGR